MERDEAGVVRAIKTVVSVARHLRWTSPTGQQGFWLLEVYDDADNLLDIGQGDSFDDAILEVAEKLKPAPGER